MILGKVTGTVVTTVSHPHYKQQKLLLVRPLVMEGDKVDEDFVAVDHAHAGIGDTVLVNREGGGARQVLNNPNACIISVIVGIIDSISINS